MTVKRGFVPNMGDVSKATRVQLSRLGRGTGSRRRATRGARRKKRTSGARTRVTKRRAKGSRSSGKLKKGSAAAKAWGAKMRRARKRK
jgi:hypothetical protein